MRYLRLLSNSVFGGALAAAYLTVIVLHLNPDLPVSLPAVAPLALTLVLSYGLHAAAAFHVVSVLRELLLGPLSPGWVSLHFLTWSAALLAGVAALVAWANAAGFELALEVSAYEALRRTAFAFGLSAAAFLTLGVLQARWEAGGRVRMAVVFAVVSVVSVALPLAWRLPATDRPIPRLSTDPSPTGAVPSPEAPRVTLVLLDGASLDVVAPAVAEGRLPNFGRLLEGGASLHLATVRPTQPETVWASAMTGKWPPKHKVRSAELHYPLAGRLPIGLLPDYSFAHALVRFGFLRAEPQHASALRAWTLWQILTSRGLASGIIGLPMTQPPDPLKGFMVSDRFSRSDEPAMALDERPTVYPASLSGQARASLASGLSPDAFDLALIPATGAGRLAPAADRVYHDLAERLRSAHDVRLLAVRYPGLDAVGHYYLRYGRPGAIDDVTDDERRRFGQVLDDYYGYVDELLGSAMEPLREQDLLLVVSGFGMEPLTFTEGIVERLFGNVRFSGTHSRAPDGFLFAYGSMVAPGRVRRGALVDIAPTALYFLGLPVARDMDGEPRTDVFAGDFNAERTITLISTYEH